MPKKGRHLFDRNKKQEEPLSLSVVVPAVIEEPDRQYYLLNGMPVVAHTLLALNQMAPVYEIIVVVREAEIKYMANICRNFAIDRIKKVVCSRAPGLGSIAAGVYECDQDAEFIGIHDPLRPFVTEKIVQEALSAAQKHGAAAPAVPVKDTIKTVMGSTVRDTPDRSTLFTLQDPLIAQSSLLKASMALAEKSGASAVDIQSALELLGLPLTLTEGTYENILVCSEVDVAAAEAIMAWRESE